MSRRYRLLPWIPAFAGMTIGKWSPDIILHRLLVAHLRVVGVLAELAAGAALAEEVPPLVELQLNLLQLRLLGFARLAFGLQLEQLMLLARQFVDPVGHMLVFHGVSPFVVGPPIGIIPFFRPGS